MKTWLTVFLVIFLVSFVSSARAEQTNFYCYQGTDGGKFFVRLPVVQPDKPDGAAESLAAGFVALGALIPRRVAFVEDGHGRENARDYLERKGYSAEDRLIIQFRPAIGFACGVLPPGTNQMSTSWMVERAERHDVIVTGSRSEGAGDAPMESFPVVVLMGPGKKKVTSIDDINHWYHYEGNQYFDENGKLKESVFDEHKGNMKVVYVERSNFVQSFHRFQGCDNWSTKEIFYEAKMGKEGVVYAQFPKIDFLADVYAIGFECLTERQGEYVKKGGFGRAMQSISEGTSNLIQRGLNLLGK